MIWGFVWAWTQPIEIWFFLSSVSFGYLPFVRGRIIADNKQTGAVFLTLYVNQLIGKVQRILLPAFGKAGPIPTSIRSILDGLADAQRTGNIRGLLQLPIVKTKTNALSIVFGESWRYVIALAFIYFFIVLIYSFLAPNSDSYLSDRVLVRLNGVRGPSWLPTRARKEHH